MASLQKAEELWFSPDVVILRADTRIFRVFAAILKAQSSVFADMFTFPQPPSAEMESIDGFPVVELHDKPEDVEVFLKAIFDSSFFMPPPAEIEYDHALGILRLAHKYDVPYLRRRALDHLGPIFPTHLTRYDDRKSSDWPLTAVNIDRRFAAIRTATEVGALWLLPVAYYDLCRQDMQRLISNESWKDFGEDLQRACLIGHSAQRQHLLKILGFLYVVKQSGGSCRDWTVCNTVRLTAVSTPVLSAHSAYPVDIWGGQNWLTLKEAELCNSCLAESKALHAAARQEFWDQLPQMFGLPGWAELEEMKRVGLSVR
ncbi:hypothetical protein B0H16DRAFT_1691275 [Mycena metata]|uniref:BTB domain-containing protein n=1 Tax=Mycena metata TaxID=1033252 RepID=A0AAD7IZ64_9AGAR|nr:hypothetical protein B0H16DRAFT_1691275 [Mycena metata]